MRGKSKILVKKEVMELLRDPKILVFMLIVPPLIFVGMGQAIGYTMQKTIQEAGKPANILLVDQDKGWASSLLLQTLKTSSNVTIGNFASAEKLVSGASTASSDYDLVVIVPKGFTRNITEGRRAEVTIYSILKGISLSSSMRMDIINSLINSFQENLLKFRLKHAYPGKNPEALLHPLEVESYTIVRGEKLPSQIAYALIGQSFAIIIAPVFLLSIGASLAAASIGVEKEEKTLETLLSFPIDRKSILLSKSLGAFIVAVVGTASMGGGFLFYLYRVFSTSASQLSINGVGALLDIIGKGTIAAVFGSFLLSIFFVLVLSLILASFTTNIREAQMIAGYIWIPIIIPVFLIAYINLHALSPISRLVLSLIPFASPIVILKEAFEGGHILSFVSVASNLVYLAISLYIGARLFNSERILTTRIRSPLRFKLSRKRT